MLRDNLVFSHLNYLKYKGSLNKEIAYILFVTINIAWMNLVSIFEYFYCGLELFKSAYTEPMKKEVIDASEAHNGSKAGT